MRTGSAALLIALAGPTVTGCGGDGEDMAAQTKTVTVATTQTQTVTVPAEAPPAATPDAAGTSGNADSGAAAGPLPDGVVGIDGRYMLRSFKNTGNGPPDGFQNYDEPVNAVTTCTGGACSVKFRVGLTAGGSKTYTLTADPERERTYVGTATGQASASSTGVLSPPASA